MQCIYCAANIVLTKQNGMETRMGMTDYLPYLPRQVGRRPSRPADKPHASGSSIDGHGMDTHRQTDRKQDWPGLVEREPSSPDSFLEVYCTNDGEPTVPRRHPNAFFFMGSWTDPAPMHLGEPAGDDITVTDGAVVSEHPHVHLRTRTAGWARARGW